MKFQLIQGRGQPRSGGHTAPTHRVCVPSPARDPDRNPDGVASCEAQHHSVCDAAFARQAVRWGTHVVCCVPAGSPASMRNRPFGLIVELSCRVRVFDVIPDIPLTAF